MKNKTLFKTLAAMCIMAALVISTSFSRPVRAIEVASVPEATAVPTATPEPIDWREVMVNAVCHADNHGGLEAEYALGGAIKYDDLYLLAKIITWECGPNWEDWGIMAIGEVVLNRVASPEFPDTIREVLYQTDPMQYQPVWEDGWEDYIPSERYVRLALRLLEGERVFADPAIVFQALFPQGSGIACTYHDYDLDNDTYFCWTNYPDNYAVG